MSSEKQYWAAIHKANACAVLRGSVMAIIAYPEEFEKEHVLRFLTAALNKATEIAETPAALANEDEYKNGRRKMNCTEQLAWTLMVMAVCIFALCTVGKYW